MYCKPPFIPVGLCLDSNEDQGDTVFSVLLQLRELSQLLAYVLILIADVRPRGLVFGQTPPGQVLSGHMPPVCGFHSSISNSHSNK